jgi:hypothetical protein
MNQASLAQHQGPSAPALVGSPIPRRDGSRPHPLIQPESIEALAKRFHPGIQRIQFTTRAAL